MRIYLAARYSRRAELCGYRDTLQQLGHQVTARWLDGDHQVDDAGLSAQAHEAERTRFAIEDWADLTSADCCISFTEAPRSTTTRGGRHVEFGAAMAMYKLCIVIGPRENVFHCLPKLVYLPDWQVDKVQQALDQFEPTPYWTPATEAARDVLTERMRQREMELWTERHDDEHTDDSLAWAAVSYALPDPYRFGGRPEARPGTPIPPLSWPASWSADWWRPRNRRRNLVKAAALLLAEIERIDRSMDRDLRMLVDVVHPGTELTRT